MHRFWNWIQNWTESFSAKHRVANTNKRSSWRKKQKLDLNCLMDFFITMTPTRSLELLQNIQKQDTGI